MIDIPFDIGQFLLDCANSDETPEGLIELAAEDMDGGDIATLFEVIAGQMHYPSIHAFLQEEMQFAADMISATQSNFEKSWRGIWEIAILQETLEDSD